MELKLGTNEHIVKSWDYSTRQVRRNEYMANLTVTNKRIVSTCKSSNELTRTELPLNMVKSISGYSGHQKRFWPILLLIIGIVLAVVPVSIAFYDSLPVQINYVVHVAVSILCGLVGLTMAISAICVLAQAMFTLEITTIGPEGSSLVLSADNMQTGKRNKNGRVRIAVSQKASQQILNELGAIVFNNVN